jgi:D-alanyl-D-alanine carboxypeptidase
MIRRILLALLSIAALAACAPAPAAAANLQTLLERWQQDTKVTAVTMAVARPGGRPWLGAAGVRDRDTGAPLAPHDLFQIGSITKTFVATVVLQLAEEDRLSLDSPLGSYLPGFPGAERITIGQLLSHTSGIPDVAQAHGIDKALIRDRGRRWTTEQVLALVAHRDRLFRPGTAYRYSNTNYVLLGEVIEAVTGTSWAAQVHRRIIDPLRLTHTFIGGVDATPPLVAGYYDLDNDGDTENVTAQPWPALDTFEGAAGAIVSNAADLARFAHALFGGQLLQRETLQAMTTPGPYQSRHRGYGLGVEIVEPDFQTLTWGHGGAEPGFRSQLLYLPDSGVVIVVLANEWYANPLDLAELTMRLTRNGEPS